MDLISTVYISAAIAPFTPPELVELLRISREKNAEHGLTGMLLYNDGNFMQVLEGPPASVDALMANIRRDPRHIRVTVLLRKKVEARTFGQWQMAFRNTRELSPLELKEVSGFLQGTFSTAESAGRYSAALRLLQIFRDKLS